MKRTLLMGLLCLAGCERVDYIELEPSQVTFKQLNNQQFISARVMARTGVRAATARVAWDVADPSIASINSDGLLKPLKSGSTEFVATYKGKEARGQVNVVLVERIEVEPTELTMTEGDSARAVAVKVFGPGNRELTDRSPALTSHDKKIAVVVGGGGIMPLDPGETTVDVQVDAVKASVKVTVEKDKKPSP